MPRHFLKLQDLSRTELIGIIKRAIELKQNRAQVYEPLKSKILGMIFEKSSTRTRFAFEAAMAQLGGHAVFLSPADSQLGRGEPVEDTARVLSRMSDIIVIRANSHATIENFALYSRVPVINALSDFNHPCQLLADIQTYTEHRGKISGKTVAWIGDGYNMCHSWINASRLLNFTLNIAAPKGFGPKSDILHENINLCKSPKEAADNADLITTDVWASMGHEEETAARKEAFAEYRVDGKIMACAHPDALFMHCLPAHKGEEVSPDVFESKQSVVWDEAENRLHTKKALLEFLLK